MMRQIGSKDQIDYTLSPLLKIALGQVTALGLVDKARGGVLTNAHVSGRGTADVEVSFKRHEYFDAKPIYVDPELDFAVVALSKEHSRHCKRGRDLIAVRNHSTD